MAASAGARNSSSYHALPVCYSPIRLAYGMARPSLLSPHGPAALPGDAFALECGTTLPLSVVQACTEISPQMSSHNYSLWPTCLTSFLLSIS